MAEPSGKQLQWWQEDPSTGTRPQWWHEKAPNHASSTPPALVAVATPVEEMDIGDELEAEAKLRSHAETTGARVAIYANPAQNIARLRRRLLIVGVPLLIFYGILTILTGISPLLFAVIALELGAGYVLGKKMHRARVHPVITITDEGLDIRSPFHDIGLVRWDEIAEVRAYTQLYRYVGIVPKDTKALCARLPRGKTRLIRINEGCRRWFYRPLRQFVAPINLAQENLPLKADDLVARINAFRVERGV